LGFGSLRRCQYNTWGPKKLRQRSCSSQKSFELPLHW
jgi:hypothetical protein